MIILRSGDQELNEFRSITTELVRLMRMSEVRLLPVCVARHVISRHGTEGALCSHAAVPALATDLV